MRVLVSATDFPPTRGGIQTLLREFCDRTTADVRVVAPADPGHQTVDASLSFPVRRVRSVAGSGRRGYLPALAAATIREARAWRPDVFFAGHVLAAPAGVWLRRRHRIPMVIGCYGVELVAPRGRRIASFVLPRADRVLAVSRFTMDAARSLGARDGEVIPVGAPSPREVSAERLAALRERFGLSGARVLLTVARLEPHKGIDVVARALSSLPPDVRYLVVGSGGSRDMFERVARDAGVADRIVFAGALSDDDLAASFRMADAFVLASRSLDGGRGGVEGCPVSLLEACAYGLPIVAGRTGGIADAIEDGVTGLLADPENNADMAAALNRALDPSFAKPLAEAAEKTAKAERNWSTVVERMQRLLEEAARIRTQ
ncbi:MAG TPA: glycosyltransferase family 4 protein [Actinomycetota bacterium]